MIYRIRNIFLAVIAGLFILSLSACTFEARGIPVEEFQRPEALAKIDASKQKKMEEAVAIMSRVTENSVFTEKRGIPEYKIGPGDGVIVKCCVWH